jgi:ParB family chromosome partitioning protein
MAKMRGLGRGLDALLNAGGESAAVAEAPRELALDALAPGRFQPRVHMDQGALEELAESIRSQGVIQPIVVRPAGNGRFEILAGERRWRAAGLAGLTRVPVVVRV